MLIIVESMSSQQVGTGVSRGEGRGGRADGRKQGCTQVRVEGMVQGLVEQRAEGRAEGRMEGRADGRAKATEKIGMNFATIRFVNAKTLHGRERGWLTRCQPWLYDWLKPLLPHPPQQKGHCIDRDN